MTILKLRNYDQGALRLSAVPDSLDSGVLELWSIGVLKKKEIKPLAITPTLRRQLELESLTIDDLVLFIATYHPCPLSGKGNRFLREGKCLAEALFFCFCQDEGGHINIMNRHTVVYIDDAFVAILPTRFLADHNLAQFDR